LKRRARRGDFLFSKRGREFARAMAVAIVDGNGVRFMACARVAVAGEDLAQVLFKNGLDEPAQFAAQARFQRIEPLLPGQEGHAPILGLNGRRRTRDGRGFRGMDCDGVVSKTPQALARLRNRLVMETGGYAIPIFQHSRDGTEAKTKESRSPDGSMSTVGDVGYLDDDGFLYLTDRRTFIIISGGMNIYPQACENLLITHPKVTDTAVFGVSNEDPGEDVKAVAQATPGIVADTASEAELIVSCRANLAHIKCPRSIDFNDQLLRLPTGKLYKRVLRDPYWAGRKSKIS
jgi:acyl-CoA synthetase (AMP-forming)/AMP-acid ligase II